MSNTNPSNALPLSGEELQLIAERRNKAAVCVSRMVIDGDSDSDDMGGSVSWRTDDVESNIIYEAKHEKQVFDPESYDSEEYKIAEFGGETNRDNDADFCFHAYTDVPRLVTTITTQAETIEAQKKEIERLQGEVNSLWETVKEYAP